MILKHWLILAFVTIVSAWAKDSSEETLNCTNYNNVVETFSSCFESESGISIHREIQSSVTENLVVTSDDILEGIQGVCSNDLMGEAYTLCKNNIVSQCLDLDTFITDSYREYIEFFCDGDEPSTYIQTVFYNGYSFDFSCQDGNRGFFRAVHQCEIAARDILKDIDNWNITYAWSMQKSMKQEWFKCTAPEDVIPQGRFWCNSTKGDLLALYWLMLSATGRVLSPPINEQARLKLQNAAIAKHHLTLG